METIRKPKWANSVLGINSKAYSCEYCGHLIKDEAWFAIRAFEGNRFVFCSASPCEEIWTKKHRGEFEPI